MPVPKKLRFVLAADTETGKVDFADFRKFCAAVAACLKRSEFVVTGRKGAIKYRIAELATGSAKFAIEGERKSGVKGRNRVGQVVGFFSRTVDSIQAGRKVDPRLGIDDIHAFKKLAAPLARGAQAVKIGTTTITPAFQENADALLNDTIPSEGAVSGKLERINVHGCNEFVLFPPIPGYAITCRFEDHLLDKVRAALKQTVTVSGTMHYPADGPYPRLVNVRTMEIHPPDDQLPKLSDLRGLGKGCTDGLTAVEFVRRLRDD